MEGADFGGVLEWFQCNTNATLVKYECGINTFRTPVK